MTFDGDDNGEAGGFDAEKADVLQERLNSFVQRAAKIGMYAQESQLAGWGPDQTSLVSQGPEMVALVNFTVGERAWSDEVQNPESHDIDEEFKAITRISDEEALEEYRRKLEERRRKLEEDG